MEARYDTAEELAAETATRALERVAGLGAERRSPWSTEFDVAVFNPSPHPRTDLVRFPLRPSSWIEFRVGTAREIALHPWLRESLTTGGYTADGRPARLLADESTDRMRLVPEVPARSIEFIATDVPAFGWKRFRLAPSGPHPADEDGGREISCEAITVGADDDGTLSVRFGDRTYAGLGAIEDVGDRGDAYDFDPVPGGGVQLDAVDVTRALDPTGVRRLAIRRMLRVPAELEPDRSRRSEQWIPLEICTEARLVPGTGRVDLQVRLANTARDHRLRLLFPTGTPVDAFHAATTFDVARRDTAVRDGSRWVHPPPATFAHQGFVSANGLTVAAPGLPEAEVTPEGVIAVTLVRAVGWLARMDLATRPQPAGPLMPAPGAQCLGTIEAGLSLFAGMDPRAARNAELGLRAVAAGDTPLVPPERSLLAVTPRQIVMTALKPAEDGTGIILRLLNPTDDAVTASVTLGFPVSEITPVRLDETSHGAPLAAEPSRFSLVVPPHALRSVRLGSRPP
jgi:hypothetical protein